MGPLTVSRVNPRYFAVGGEAVYLTGSHVWNNLQDGLGPGGACAEVAERNDFDAYLEFLKAHGHNFIRLWRWEHFRSQAEGGAFHLCMSPQPWPRTPKGFDLSRFDPEYFQRLRARTQRAGERGFYVSVMLFEGWGLHLSVAAHRVSGHPFGKGNNVNGIGIKSIMDYQVLPLDPAIEKLQKAYIRKVVDTVHDLPNVLYEVANESCGESTAWQYWVINTVREHDDTHPIGMTMQWPVPDITRTNEPLFDSPADWVSPGFDSEDRPSRWLVDPPPADGRKVILSDTDHYAPSHGDALWAWKSFVRGHHPILMDYDIIDVTKPLDSLETARFAMGDTLSFARRVDLLRMTPRGDLSTTGYALADPGREYLVLQPETGPFTIRLEPGPYRLEWHNLTTRETVAASWDSTTLTPPFRGPAVAYLYSG